MHKTIVVQVHVFWGEHNHSLDKVTYVELEPTIKSGWATLAIDDVIKNCETKVWLILILMITKQGLKLMIIFQVWLGKMISKVAIIKTNQTKEKSWRRRPPQREVFFKSQAS